MLLTLEEHGIDEHGSICVLHIFGHLRQFAISGLGGPLIDGIDSTTFVTEVDFGVVEVVVFLAVLHIIVGKADRAGTIEPVVDLPGDVTLGGVAHLGQELGEATVEVLILQLAGAQHALHLRGGGGLPPKGHHAQRGGHHHRGDQDVLQVLLLGHVVVQVKGQVGTVVCQGGGMAAELGLLSRGCQSHQDEGYSVCQPHSL